MKTRFLALAVLACFVSAPAVHAAVADSDLEEAIELGDPAAHRPVAAVELGYFAPSFPEYAPDRRGNGIRLGGELLPYAGRFGKLGLGFSLAYGKLKGNVASPFVEVIPMEASLSYRADVVENQFVVPFIHTGVQVTYLHQQFVPGMQRFNGVEYGGGLALCLDFVDRISAVLLDRSTGIRNTYAVVDFRHVGYLGKIQGPNLTRDELRFSLRFEF